jgi:hypothetical protein
VSVTLAGRTERARVAHAFSAVVTDPGRTCGADAALTGSGCPATAGREGPGETVMVRAGDGIVRVEVTGRSRRGCRNWVR